MTLSTQEVKDWGLLCGIFLVAVVQQFTISKAKETAKEGTAKLDSIHTLVNSNMGKQLRLVSVMARRIADMTKNPTDIEAAATADSEYNAYLVRQADSEKSNSSDI